MNILQLSKYYAPYSGGIESVVRELTIGLKSRELHHIEVLASNDQSSGCIDIVDQIRVTRLPQNLKLFSQPISFKLLFQLIPKLKNQAIIHLHTPNPLWELFIFFLIKKHQVWVITHHSDIVNQKYLSSLVFFLQRLIYSRVDAFIVPTINHLEYSKILKSFKDKCHLIPFAFRFKKLHQFKPNPILTSEIEKKFKDYAIFIGRLVPYKGLDILLEAMTLVPQDYQVLIIGVGPLNSDLQKKIEQQNDSHRIFLLGKVDEDSLHHYLHLAKFLVLPSINQSENFGIVQLEAFAMKKAVIVSKLQSGASSLVTEGESGFLVEPADPKHLASRMMELFKDPLKAQMMGEKAYQNLQNNFSYEAMIDSHLKLYETCLEAKGKG